MSRKADLIVWECDTDLDDLRPSPEQHQTRNPRSKKGKKKVMEDEEEEDEDEGGAEGGEEKKQMESKIKYRRAAK